MLFHTKPFISQFSWKIYERVNFTTHQSIPISLQEIAAAVSKIEPEKSSKVQEAKSFLVSNPNCASASQLHSKVEGANKKYTKIEQLVQCSQEKYEIWYVSQYLISCCCFLMQNIFIKHFWHATGTGWTNKSDSNSREGYVTLKMNE